MAGSTPADGLTVKGLWGSLTDWSGPIADPTEPWDFFFQNTGSEIARELEGEIGRVNRPWLEVPEERSTDPASLYNKEPNQFFARQKAL